MLDYVSSEVILNGAIYRKVIQTDSIEPEIWVNGVPYVLKFPFANYSPPSDPRLARPGEAVMVDKLDGIWHRGDELPPGIFKKHDDALFNALDHQGESRGKFKLYDKSIKISSKPSALRRFWQRLADDFRTVFID